MKPKLFFIPALSLSVVLALWIGSPKSRGEVAGADVGLANLLNEIANQQLIIAENQVRIDAQVLEIAENVRLARIFASRGGR
ncbi:MAG: hypothetical protein WCI46_01400 [Verrucomicrobiota bacterium]